MSPLYSSGLFLSKHLIYGILDHVQGGGGGRDIDNTYLHRCVHVAGYCASKQWRIAPCRPLSETLGARLKQLGGRRRSSSGSGRSYAQVGERGDGRNANVARMGAAGSGAAGQPASKWANEPLADKI